MLSVSESKLAPAVILEIISDMSVQVHPPPVGKMQGGSVPSSYLLPFCPSVVDNFYLNCCQLYAECLRHSYNYHSIHIFIIAMCVSFDITSFSSRVICLICVMFSHGFSVASTCVSIWDTQK